jgi:hypothetical protein
MDYNSRVQIMLKILNNQFDIFHSWLYNVYHSNSMYLFSQLFNIKRKRDIILSKIFLFKQCRNNILIRLIINNNFPCVVAFSKYLLEQLFLLYDEVLLMICR